MIRCPHCDCAKIYRLRTRPILTCANPGCRRQFSADYGTARYRRKKPLGWYERVIELHKQGMNAHQISQMGIGQHKSIWSFLKKLEMENA